MGSYFYCPALLPTTNFCRIIIGDSYPLQYTQKFAWTCPLKCSCKDKLIFGCGPFLSEEPPRRHIVYLDELIKIKETVHGLQTARDFSHAY